MPGRHTRITGIDQLDKLVRVDQSPIGRTPRSNPATYTGVFDKIRTLFAATTEAKVRGYQPGRFSFNVKGGRCEACSGDGTIKIEMNFLPDVYVPVRGLPRRPVQPGDARGALQGQDHRRGAGHADRGGRRVLRADPLDPPLPARPSSTSAWATSGSGQPAPTLSGGEAQRVKLASELQKRSTGRTVYILDEPTTGLHFEDIRKLLKVHQRAGRQGQHGDRHRAQPRRHQDLGLDRRHGPGGRCAAGARWWRRALREVAATPESYTGQFLVDMLETPGGARAGSQAAQGQVDLQR